MKNAILLSTALTAMFLASCGGAEKPTDAKAQEELKSIQLQIADLQKKEQELLKQLGGKESARTKLVETQTIALSTFQNDLTVEGMVDAQNSTIATSKVPATVTEILVKVGQQVSAGQALARLDNTSLVQSKRELEQQYDFAKTLYEKQLRLWKKGVGTEVQYLSAKNQMEALGKSLNTLNTNIDMYTIKAPINGSIEAVDLKVGQVAAPGMPYFKVVNVSIVKAVAEVSEAYAGSVHQGDEVEIEFPDLNKKINSRIGFASKFIDPLNRTFSVEVPLVGVTDIKPNMVARLKITEYQKKNTVVVPSNCVQVTEKEAFVMVAKDENGKMVALKQLVKLGLSNKNITEVIDGLQVGDLLIVNGFQELAEGQVLEIKGATKNG
jgi:membrane fusion protein, multidrug efflux system